MNHDVSPTADELGTITFDEGYADSPNCPCGNNVLPGDGFRPVMVTDTAAGLVGTFDDCTQAWFDAGRHVACVSDGCLRVWSDAQISADGMRAPVLLRLHRVVEPSDAPA